MKANELRIGNYFLLPNGEIGKITYHELRLLTVAIEKPDYKPIPLTEELLLKCGFENEDDWLELFVNDNLSITWFGYLGLSVDGVFVFFNEKKYLHQLQNLYFALTGEELKIEL